MPEWAQAGSLVVGCVALGGLFLQSGVRWLLNHNRVRTTKGRPAEPLARVLAVLPDEPVIVVTDGVAQLNRISAQVRNTSQTMARGRFCWGPVQLDGAAVYREERWSDDVFIPQAAHSAAGLNFTGGIPIPVEIKNIILELSMESDTVPKSGTRTSFIRMNYEIVSFSPLKLNGTVLHQTEG
jgi:hypothetical protein